MQIPVFVLFYLAILYHARLGSCYTVCAVPYARCASCPVSAQPTLFLSRYANLYTFGLDAYWLTATYQKNGELAYSVTIVGSVYVRILSAVFWGRAS